VAQLATSSTTAVSLRLHPRHTPVGAGGGGGSATPAAPADRQAGQLTYAPPAPELGSLSWHGRQKAWKHGSVLDDDAATDRPHVAHFTQALAQPGGGGSSVSELDWPELLEGVGDVILLACRSIINRSVYSSSLHRSFESLTGFSSTNTKYTFTPLSMLASVS